MSYRIFPVFWHFIQLFHRHKNILFMQFNLLRGKKLKWFFDGILNQLTFESTKVCDYQVFLWVIPRFLAFKKKLRYVELWVAPQCFTVAMLAHLNKMYLQEMSELNFQAVLTLELLLVRHQIALRRPEDHPFLTSSEFSSTRGWGPAF